MKLVNFGNKVHYFLGWGKDNGSLLGWGAKDLTLQDSNSSGCKSSAAKTVGMGLYSPIKLQTSPLSIPR